MHHTLIPAKEHAAIHREYRIRLVAVFFVAMALAAVVGMASLFPSFLSASFSERAALEAVVVGKDANQAETQAMQAELTADSNLLGVLAVERTVPDLSGIIEQLVSSRSDITITSISISRTGTTTVSAILSGVAPTRNDLIAFEGRLQNISPTASVDLPIDQLAKSTHIEYSLRFSE